MSHSFNNLFPQIDHIYHRGGVVEITSILGLLEIKGDDRIKFLENILTIDLSSLPPLRGKEALILSPKAAVHYQLWVFRFPESFLLILPQPKIDECHEYLEARIFLEKIQISKITSPLYYFENRSPRSHLEGANKTITTLTPLSAAPENFTLRLDISGKPGYLVWGSPISPPDGMYGVTPPEVFPLLVYENHPQLTDGFPPHPAAMELPRWERFFDFDKGCYPGQEIITRSRTRNQSPARRYVILRSCPPTPDNLTILSELKTTSMTIGHILTHGYSPRLGTRVALAHVHRDFAVAGQILTVLGQDSQPIRIEVVDNHSIQKASGFRELMEEGLNAYHSDDYPLAREKFTEASRLDPFHPDPWEAMAVIEEKNGNIDEAIRLNKTFAEKNPESPLAKTNLSRLYMLKGWIEKAEEEKRNATVLMFKATAREKKLQDQQVTSVDPRKEIEHRKRIFRQVLEMDSKDGIANFGLGKILFEDGDYPEAEKHLRITVLENPQTSLAYSFLAECLLKQGNREEATQLLRTGIEQAREQGQMIPLKAMEERLNQLQ